MHINGFIGNFINLPVQFLMILIGFIYIEKIIFTKKDIFNVFVFLFIPTILLYISIFWVGTIYFFLSLSFFFFIRTKKFSTYVYMSILFLIAIITDHIATLLVFHSVIEPRGEIIQLLLRIIVFMVLFILFVLLFKIMHISISKKVQFSFNIQLVLIISIIITLIAFYYNIFRVYRHLSMDLLKVNTAIFSIYSILIFVFIILLYYLVKKEQKLQARENEYHNFETYVNSLEQVNKDMQKFRHDYLNVLLSIRGYIYDKDLDGLERHFEKNIINFEKKSLDSNRVIGHLENLQVRGLKGLIFTKISLAIENNLSISVEVNQLIENIGMDIINLNRILGILMDNAIEGCIEQDTTDIQMAIIQHEMFTSIIIRNRIREVDISIDRILEDKFTTKITGQGIGLSTVKNIVNQDSNVTFNLRIEKNWFYVELHIMEEKK